MSTMRNVYNLMTDAFSRIRKDEKDYQVRVTSSNTMAVYVNIVITSRDLTRNGITNLHLVLDPRGVLRYLNGNNSLFSISEWNSIYSVFDEELHDVIYIPMPIEYIDDET